MRRIRIEPQRACETRPNSNYEWMLMNSWMVSWLLQSGSILLTRNISEKSQVACSRYGSTWNSFLYSPVGSYTKLRLMYIPSILVMAFSRSSIRKVSWISTGKVPKC